MYFFWPKISPFVKGKKRPMALFSMFAQSMGGAPLALAIKSTYSSGVRKSMRNPSSIYAPVLFFQSSEWAGLMGSGAASVSVGRGVSSTSPWSASSKSSISLNSVVLPAPLLPTNPRMSPLLMVKWSIFTAVFSPKVLTN